MLYVTKFALSRGVLVFHDDEVEELVWSAEGNRSLFIKSAWFTLSDGDYARTPEEAAEQVRLLREKRHGKLKAELVELMAPVRWTTYDEQRPHPEAAKEAAHLTKQPPKLRYES